MYLAGYIERLGTGTSDMLRIATNAGLKEPEFIQVEDFKIILYRPATPQVTPQDTDVLPQEFRSTSVEVQNLVLMMEGEMNRTDIQDKLELKHEGNFRDNYLVPALETEMIEMKYKQKNHPRQKYRLTAKGLALKKNIDPFFNAPG
jgi:predicted HTH transcriptional regulator